MPNGQESTARAMVMTTTQVSRLLPVTLESLNCETPLHVLDLGRALPETIAFFSNYRCKLHIADLYDALPVPERGNSKDDAPDLAAYFREALFLPDGVQFDVVYFWDSINFLNRQSLTALMETLRPHLHSNTLGHCFAVHNVETPAAVEYYGIQDRENFSVRFRNKQPIGYHPHRQSELDALLRYLRADSSVLMRDRRVEILLKSSL